MVDVGIGLIGLGNIGSALARHIQEEGDPIARNSGVRIRLRKAAVRDPSKERECEVPQGLLTTDPSEVFRDPSVQIVVELMGGTEAREIILAALAAGKHVVTANKNVISEHGREILEKAREAKRWVGFEASVCAGIPILTSLHSSLVGARITRLMGIVNGTTNYILTRMDERGEDLAPALAEAQRLGFAEPDPTFDVNGMDAAYKISILASIIFRRVVRADAVHREGIERVTRDDLEGARRFGYALKPLGVIRDSGEGIEARVHPAFLPRTHPLASVREEFNAIHLETPLTGPLMFHGRGAGKGPTTSALLGDIIDIAWNLEMEESAAPLWELAGTDRILPAGRIESRHYLRMHVDTAKPGDASEAIGRVTTALGRGRVPVQSVVASTRGANRNGAEVGGAGGVHGAEEVLELVTGRAVEGDLGRALDEIERHVRLLQPVRKIRIEE